ncbi:MAG: hypothetical protein PUJ39_05780 [Eubacteriales bacterium]|nr:hypothetical protein [Eubacteriales bacterium]
MADPEEGKRKHDEAAGNKGIHYFVSAGAFKRLQIQKNAVFPFSVCRQKSGLVCGQPVIAAHFSLPPCAKSGPIPHQNIDKSRFSNYDERVSNRRRNEHHGSIDDG